ncbi:MAG TPA: choice-of-anchor tandem repeat GloVer-containing protein [Candidatus Binatia bacterium]|nr:choice-of-anchor tandem repeat GloVer-containing protein [Candidatus Binatia bacterium]
MFASALAARAQTYTILHQFGGQDGANPAVGLTLDNFGNLYGTTYVGGAGNAGSVFRLTHRNGAYLFAPLYSFHGSDGRLPLARPIVGPDGSIFGTTSEGGTHTLGMVYNVRPFPNPPFSVLAPWNETDLYNFVGGTGDGSDPQSDLAVDAAGNFYGTTSNGGANGNGTVFKLTHTGGGWTESVLYSFGNLPDGKNPTAGVAIDAAGNLYGTTLNGGANGRGTVYKLTPSGGGYTESVLYSFAPGIGGEYPQAGVILDSDGNLYGATTLSDRGGAVFELSPSGGGWTYTVLWHNFNDSGTEGGPTGNLVRDSDGNLYGATQAGGLYHQGSLFMLTPGVGGYTYTDLHDFTGGVNDGSGPRGNVVRDANGNLFGTTWMGGGSNKGVVYELTP